MKQHNFSPEQDSNFSLAAFELPAIPSTDVTKLPDLEATILPPEETMADMVRLYPPTTEGVRIVEGLDGQVHIGKLSSRGMDELR